MVLTPNPEDYKINYMHAKIAPPMSNAATAFMAEAVLQTMVLNVKVEAGSTTKKVPQITSISS